MRLGKIEVDMNGELESFRWTVPDVFSAQNTARDYTGFYNSFLRKGNDKAKS